MKKAIKYTLLSILIIGISVPVIGFGKHNQKEDANKKEYDTLYTDKKNNVEEEEKMTKERKKFKNFDADCYNAIYDATEEALQNIIRIYDYQKDIPRTKKMAKDMKEYTGDNEQSKQLILVELGSCSEFSERLFFSFLEAKEIYIESGRRGTYLEYILEHKMLDRMIDDQYKTMENLFFEKDDNIYEIIKDIFKKLDKLTEGETLEENKKLYKKKYIVLEEVLNSMGSPYYDEIVEAEKKIRESNK